MNVQIKPNVALSKQKPSLPFECVALVLQGGGALGAYQAGVYEALAEVDIQPDWIAGVSIGAINAAIIAGNAPDKRIEKLREFWRQVTTDGALVLVRGCELGIRQKRDRSELSQSGQCPRGTCKRLKRLFQCANADAMAAAPRNNRSDQLL